MHKLTKQVLTGVVALGLLAPVATQAISNSPQTIVNAKKRHHWHYGVPKAIKGYWRGNLTRSSQYYHHGYVRNLVEVKRNSYGFNPFPYWYNSHKHFKMSGATNGEFWHPHYKYYGHGKYVITSGDSFDGRPYSMKYSIKKHGRNHFTMRYWNEDKNYMEYGGYFTRAHSYHQWLRK